MDSINDKLDTISLNLGLIIQVDELQACIDNSVQMLFPNTITSCLIQKSKYSKSSIVQTATIESKVYYEIPWDCMLDDEELVKQIDLGNDSQSPTFDYKGILIPTNCTKQAKQLGFYIFIIISKCKFDADFLQYCHFLNKQVSITVSRLSKTETFDTAVHLHKTDSQKPAKRQTILELCGSLHNSDGRELQKKILNYLLLHTNASSGFLIFISSKTNELLVQVINQRILDEALTFDADEDVLLKRVWQEKEEIIITKSELNQLETSNIMKVSNNGTTIENALLVPIIQKDNEKQVIAILCLLNKVDNKNFNSNDIEIINDCFFYTTSVLFTTIAFQREQILTQQSKKILDIACNIFSQMDDLNKLLMMIMEEARNLIKAEKCSVFLIDKDTNELVAKIFDGVVTSADNQEQEDIRMPINQGVAGYVATHGQMLNIRDAYNYPLFNQSIDKKTGFKTHCILSFPLKDDQDNIVGVAQLCNKQRGSYFTKTDEEVARAFAIYCCISITHSLLYKKVQDAQKRSQLANELMMYHMQIPDSELEPLLNLTIQPVTFYLEDFESFRSIPRNIPDCDTVMACISMFDTLQFIQRWKIHRKTLTRFICMVKRNYREPPYHNWMHAFSVAHFVYLCLRNLYGTLKNQLRDIEMFALFVASLCHDVDHRGTNNKFQVDSGSVLADLYSSQGSVLERHHFSQTVCILNTGGCNLFENLPSNQYREILDLIRVIILATDINHHSQIRGQIERLSQGLNPITGQPEPISKDNKQHRELLLCLLMTSADLSDQTKPWSNTRAVAKIIYQEFFTQGDLERVNLGLDPAEMYDRSKADIPQQQLGFLRAFVLPLYTVLSKFYVETECLVRVIEINGKNWELICHKIINKEIDDTEEQIFHADIEGLMQQ